MEGVLNIIDCPSDISKNMDVDDGKEASTSKERDEASANMNPATVHVIDAIESAGITAVASVRTSTPRDGVSEADMLTLDGLRLEQVAAGAFVSKALKRNPLTDTSLNECELSATAILKDMVRVTLCVFAT
jgi:hypothetical protein